MVLDWVDDYTASDNCGTVTVTSDFDPGIIDYCTGADITVTWTATDDCGNVSTTSATIVVEADVTAPDLTAPADLDISCLSNQQSNDVLIANWLNTFTVFDGCDNDVVVTNDYNWIIDYCTGANIVVTWTQFDKYALEDPACQSNSFQGIRILMILVSS